MDKIHFEKLTPAKDTKLGIYEYALNFVFENSDIKNVAISGPYAAGKSSVIESYEKENKNLKFLHISLANFNATEKSDMQNLDNNHTNVKESILEGKILNQLLYQIDVSKIPQTNFRVKHKVSDKNILKATIISIIFILAISHIYFYHRWYDFVSGLVQFKFLRFLQLTISSISLLFSGLLATIIASMAIYKLIKMQRDKSIFKRFKFQGNEIEIFEKNDESYFDKYLNEVLYLFDNSDADAIVFEDMDRYNVNQIFQRLREVNTLINSRRIKESNSSLKFFYLLRDDIFTSKDRTKFFDFIIPVVPILDSSNSYDQFITHLKKGQVFEKFDKHFLQGISLYIDDMRILKNVYNEFIIYYNKIGTTEQDYNKLLAIIAYKNIFPRDFSDTQINIGFVSTLFNNREKIIENNLIKTNKKIEEIEEKIVSCKNEILKDTNELDIVYRSKGYFNTNNSEYIRRKKIIDMNNEKCMDDLSKQVTELKLEKSKLSNKKLKELITRENADEIFNICYKNFIGPENAFKEIKSSQYFDLIKYLIINGYIDETYEDYMTYFYPNSLTKKDKIFLRSVTDRKAKEWEYKIDKCQIVISMLREVDFHEKETLNFSLFSYLSNTKQIEVNKKYLIAFIEQLKKGKNFYFVKEFFDFVRENRDYILIYIEIINKYWPSFLHEIIDESTFTDEWRKEYIVLTLTYCNEDIINSINEDNFLSIIISSDPQFLDIKDPKVERLIDKFLHLNIKFQKIEYEKCKDLNEDLFHAVYCNKLYDFTFENISVMLKYIYIVQDDNEIIHKNYSLIIGDKGSKLFEYVSENIDHYIRIVIDNCKGSINDTSEAALNLINNSQVEYLKKQEYIQFLTTGLKSLEDINEKKLWNLFLQKNLIKYSENNILEYYFKSENGLDDVLVNFINTNEESLKFSPDKIDLKFGENSSSELFDDIVICNTLNDNKYKDIINDLNYAFHNFDIKEIQDEKIKILIDLGTIKMNAENVRFMRTDYVSKFIYFIEHNICNYIDDVIDKEPISNSELLNILDSSIEDNLKIKLIDCSEDTIKIISKNYSDTIKSYILKNNFDTSELVPLIKKYEKQDEMIKEILRKLYIENIDIIVKNHVELPIDLFEFLISNENILLKDKIVILTDNIDKFSKREIRNYIKMIGSKDYERIFLGRPKLEITETNRNLLKKLKSKELISYFREKNGFFRVGHRNLK